LFRPVDAVELPDNTPVEIELRVQERTAPVNPALSRVYEVLSRRHESGHADTAERHDEHQFGYPATSVAG
jgi:hypothetical protein